VQIEAIASKGQLIPLLFCQHTVAASQTDVQLNVVEAGNNTLAVQGISAPFSGSIIGISADLSAAASAGTLSVGVTLNGTESAVTTQSFTTQTAKYGVFQRDSVAVVAGDKIGVEITTNAGWNGTSSDLAVIVYFLAEMAGI
jgi:hypothetical protein